MNELHDQDICACGSVSFQGVLCPERNKYIDVCISCGNCGSHLCQDEECVSNNKESFKDFLTEVANMEPRKGIMAQIAQDHIEAEIEVGERRYYESVMHDELSNDIDFDNRDEEVA